MLLYFDHAATTPLDPRVAAAVAEAERDAWGNAASLHEAGRRAAAVVERARILVAQALHGSPEGVVFTSGGTEANNLALKGTLLLRPTGHLVTCAIEHPSVLEPARWLVSRGYGLTVLPVDGEGFVDPAAVEAAIRPDTVLVSIQTANNEIGTVQDLPSIGRICRDRGVCFHADACQSLTKVPIDVEACGLDLVTVNGHKMHGPKGVGALWVRPGVPLEPILHGGGQEAGLRGGTTNTPAIAGLAMAIEAASPEDVPRMEALRDRILDAVLAWPGTRLNGPRHRRLPNHVSVVFPGVRAPDLVRALSDRGVAVSAGSACHAARDIPSAVLSAIGRTPEESASTVRITVSRPTTSREVDALIPVLEACVRRLRRAGT
ncbi:MAG: cysteine desulfurase [Deltaproteobacteria bacterium]|nr:cysteine desulfurase [Deltaproteobacteria bacterium]